MQPMGGSMALTTLLVVMLPLVCESAPLANGSAPSCTVHLDVSKMVEYWSSCQNSTIAQCPQGPCTDMEYMARALANGGAITLPPDGPAGCPSGGMGYECYEMASKPGVYFNLALAAGFMDWLEDAGFTKVSGSAAEAPRGAIVLYQVLLPSSCRCLAADISFACFRQAYGAPAIALGGGKCSSHTPVWCFDDDSDDAGDDDADDDANAYDDDNVNDDGGDAADNDDGES
jgi:hypothetical protein